MKILAVDDEVLQLGKLEKSIKTVIQDSEVVSFSLPSETLDYIENNSDIDIAFLDIELGSVSGIQIAKKLQAKNPKVNIVFVTAYCEYATTAFSMHASGYVTKPVTPEKIKLEMENLRYPMPRPETNKRISIKCFGMFEVYVDGEPLRFKREKSKELLAFLVDKKGAFCSPREICCNLWEEDKLDYLRKITKELRDTLKAVGLENVFVSSFKKYRIDPSLVDCDFYDYIDNKPYAVKAFVGEYMSQYSWAEITRSSLMNM